ncbi:bacteriorhodopsin [Blastococcus sp. VKM Ac-2987]|uniref:bacteriorhodopsin n=1 Tax=Blastococcus sp. VKM Ac-2987 TaxID=3004141 RepID=UPI0022AB8AB3|nr:bacteriorhodopsin [Blastococcus sp. VKM Ac-2987]MCZ2860642.1 bacteriorhodopsin [Blastococcus sp. VKM Ac-2987]
MNVENTFTYDFFQYTIVSHVFTLGYAAMAAGLVYFILTSKNSLPRYQLSSTLSAVVMLSAFLELLVISLRWDGAFTWDGEAFSSTGALFSNGYRYMNWTIDVPVLLTQLLIVLGITGAAFRRGWITFTVAGLAMIYTGYAGQFYEVERSAPFWVWGSISTVFFLVILWLVRRTVYGNVGRLPEEVRPLVKAVWWLLLVSWMLYPGAYLMPALWDSADGVVARQITYTVADITSKVVYGILLAVIARKVSKHEGHDEAVAADVTMPRGGITEVAPPGRTT